MAKELRIVAGGGHGGGGVTPGKRTPDGEYEWDFNNHVVNGFIDELDKYENVTVKRVDDDDASDGYEDVPLRDRVNVANRWGADYYFSFHQNAYQGKWGSHGGTETYYFEGSSEGKRVAELVQKAMLDALGLRNRGIKRGNHLYIIRKTTMPAVLSEGGFMDSTIDIKVLRDSKKLYNAGVAVGKAFANYKKLKLRAPVSRPTPSKPTTGWFRVRKSWADAKSQKGAFRNIEHAKDLADKLAGYEVYDDNGKMIYSGETKSSNTYTVKRGDTLWGISRTYGTSVAELKKVNNLKSDTINPGLKLAIPSSKGSSTPAKPAPKPSYIGKRVESKVGKLRFYSRPSWEDKDVAGHLTKGLGFPTIVEKVKVGNGHQYKVKNSRGATYYVTASEKYVRVK